ncbi:GM23870 [Drosophila sechellia]|uniref:TBC1 domain family member 30 n=1 Tax=Drosophila sechellia TaxID=7238 RepID=B4HJ77_DROSE|nr:GM23870 [Drosophila sechellia]
MRFSLSPPPQKAITSARLTSPIKNSLSSSSTITTPGSNNRSPSSTMLTRNGGGHGTSPTASGSGHAPSASAAADDEATSDYNQWLHAMKLVARLPGGTPPEFRRKLWLSLADKYLKSKNVDWAQQREKCFCEEWREDDEELGIQIVKDLHRTGSNLCTGPAGSINQAKLKRILLGYARYNPEVGYCQGFNMLGALILQVMDKEEEESMKVMIYLVEGVLPTGYFYGSMGGLQADMGVFRELMQTRLPRLAKHLQRLQGPVENAFEPPLTNVFTMQWFLTMFCTCLPMSCVLRVWDLVLIEGSDVLLRTALVLWSLLEERVISVRSADEFYGKMGSYSSELLNGHLVDSNGLIERVVKLGPIADLRQLRDKHLYNIAPLRHKQGLQLYYDEEDTHSDEERLAVATVFGLNWGRRGSVGPAAAGKQQVEQKDRLALDISLLKKQYDRLRERQKQAHVILTTACSTAARQGSGPASSTQQAVPVNQLLLGRPAIVTNKGKRVGAPLGAIPPARKPSLPAVLHTKPTTEKQLRRGETLLWRDTDPSRRRRDSLTWKEIKADRAAMIREGVDVSSVRTQKLRTRFGKSDSSSYSEDSDGEQESGPGGGGGSSTDTSLCDDDDPKSTEKSPKQKAKLARKLKEQKQLAGSRDTSLERQRPKSWAPSSHEIPFMLMGTDSGDEKDDKASKEGAGTGDQAEDSATESGRYEFDRELHLISSKMEPLKLPFDPEFPGMTSVSPIPSPREKSEAEEDLLDERKPFDVSDDGVTNQYFERVNSVERPKRLELSYSLNEEETDTNAIYLEEREKVEGHSGDREYNSVPPFYPRKDDDGVQGDGKVPKIRDDNIPGENRDDYKELLSMTIEETTGYKPPPPTASTLSNASRKRRDPRRKTLTRSSTIEIEERYQALERRISQDQPSGDRQAKYIPSTATLEERFNTLEKQLSAEKQRKELTEMEAEYPIKSERIPSTADLESRFNSLTKQMSSSESSSKTPIDLKDEDRPSGSSSKNQKDSEKTSKLHKSEEPESNTKETTQETETSDSKESKSDEKEAEQPRLKKLPSTAELEDRFNALERKMSVQKSSPSKNKKEPPDEKESESTKEPEEPEESEKANENTSGSQSPIAKKDPKDSDQKKPETKEKQSPIKNQNQKVKAKSPKSEEIIENDTSKPKEDSQESKTATNKKVEANRKLSSEESDHTKKEKRVESPGKNDKETAETKIENVKDSSRKSDYQKKEAAKTSVSQTEADSKPGSKGNSTSKNAEQEKTPRLRSAPKKAKYRANNCQRKKKQSKTLFQRTAQKKWLSISTDVGPMDPNGKTVVLLMDNEHRASKVRRLTRANTEELEDLFQALEKQLNDRNLVKSEDGRLIRVDPKPSAEQVEQTQAISDLTKEIEDFTSAKPEEENPKEAAKEENPESEEPEDFDWGPNTVKHHLKRKTVYLPSTKELESRFRSLERQIKLLEDVEKIDVEQRLNEIERKIKLQYSLSHEKDLNKYLELCEGKGLDDDEPLPVETPSKEAEITTARDRSRSPGRKAVVTKSPYTSPSRKATIKTPHSSPTRKPVIKSPYTSPSRKSAKSPYTSPSRNRQRSPSPTRSPERKSKRSPYTSPARRKPHPNDLPISDDLEYKYRVLDLVRSKSKENLAKRMNDPNRKPAIHPLEMILSPSPDADAIPTTGELEHRIRVLDEKLKSPAKTRSKSRSRSPTIEDIKRQKMRDEKKPRTPVHNLERIVSSPSRPEPPTAEELEERIRILEQEHKFDFKTQKDYKAFNQKLKDVISPSLSFDEFRSAKSREQSPRRHGPTTPKSALRRDDFDEGYCGGTHTSTHYRPTSPKVIRFRDEDDEDQFEEAPRPKSRQTSERMVGTTHDVLDCLTENTKILQRILKKTLADQPSATRSYASSSEGLDALGSRLMRETSPITRTGTHTGVPLRTGENINDRLSSIKNSIKSIDTLCEEKPYQKEKCQRYIDSLFTDSLHFASKKSSLEDLSLSRSLSRSESRGRSIHRSGDYAPSIRVTSEHRSLGSADSRRSPLGNRDTSPLHHRSHRDISRELSPRRRRLEEEDEERKDRESSRVRRDNLLPNYFADNRSELSSGSSLTGFNHKVDRQLEETCAKYADDRRSACRTPLSHPYESRTTATRHSHTDPVQIPANPAGSATATDSFPRPVSPYRQPYDPYHRSPGGAGGTPLYQPGKLEIRHTTVTSTFYDRFLTEKQIERQTHSRPPSRSPVVSPSVPAKSYVELCSTTSATSSTTATSTSASSFMSSSYAGPSFSLPSASNYSYLNPVSGSGSGISSISPRASCSDLRSTTSGPTSTSTTSVTTSSYVPYNFTSSFTSRLNDPITTSTVSAVSTSSLTHSTGVYNPMMSFTLREPLASSSLGGSSASPLLPFQFNRTFTSNFDKEQNKQ